MFLDKIITYKKEEVAARKAVVSSEALQKKLASAPASRSFAAGLRNSDRLTLIAEIKKQSPAKGLLVEHFDPLAIAEMYTRNGVDAISVLTDNHFWGGSHDSLLKIRTSIPGIPPLLCKDVIIDEYQIYEARTYGADAILLIAAVLEKAELIHFYEKAAQLGMDVLLEIHNEEELKKVRDMNPNILGINNRNLDTFEIDIATTQKLIALLGDLHPIVVSESGISNQLSEIREWGADAILVGESIMVATDPEQQVKALLNN